jgi:hypothetical protein
MRIDLNNIIYVLFLKNYKRKALLFWGVFLLYLIQAYFCSTLNASHELDFIFIGC